KYKDENGAQIKLFEVNQLKPLEVRFADININEEAFKVNVVPSSSNIDATQNKQELVLTQTLTNTVLTKKFTIYPDGHYDLTVSSTNDKPFFVSNGFRPNVLVDMYAVHGFITKLNDNSLTTIEDGSSKKNETFVGSKFVSNFDRYYATVIYNFEKSLQVTVMPDSSNNPQSFIHSSG
ncbi:membrane protein insertase YidC, partial [Aliarcobacter butzleri]|nr:membrane protein insertase YidC [Aliarcobacter butzleri]